MLLGTLTFATIKHQRQQFDDYIQAIVFVRPTAKAVAVGRNVEGCSSAKDNAIQIYSLFLFSLPVRQEQIEQLAEIRMYLIRLHRRNVRCLDNAAAHFPTCILL